MNMAILCGIQPRDALLMMQPGTVFALFDMWRQQHGLKKEE